MYATSYRLKELLRHSGDPVSRGGLALVGPKFGAVGVCVYIPEKIESSANETEDSISRGLMTSPFLIDTI